jgi:Uracil-DNA glycosylase
VSTKDGIEVMLSLFDDAKRVIAGDSLAEDLPVFDYELEEKVSAPGAETKSVSSVKEYNNAFKDCHKCGNCLGRESVYPGFGSDSPLALFIGDGPCQADRALSKIFSGDEGRELVKWINVMQLERSEFYITNIVKCLNTKRLKTFPCASEIGDEVSLLGPKAMLVLGQFAARMMFADNRTIDEYRKDESLEFKGIPVTVTYHPRDVIRNRDLKRPVWDDIKRFAAQLSITSRLPRKG